MRLYVDTALRGEWAELGLLDDPEPDVAGCGGGQRHVAVTPEGDVFPCSHARRPAYRMGNLLTDDLDRLWSGGPGSRHGRDTSGTAAACVAPAGPLTRRSSRCRTTRIPLKSFFEAVEERLSAFSADELRSILLRHGAGRRPEGPAGIPGRPSCRARGPTTCIQGALRQDDLLAEIDDLVAEIRAEMEDAEDV